VVAIAGVEAEKTREVSHNVATCNGAPEALFYYSCAHTRRPTKT